MPGNGYAIYRGMLKSLGLITLGFTLGLLLSACGKAPMQLTVTGKDVTSPNPVSDPAQETPAETPAPVVDPPVEPENPAPVTETPAEETTPAPVVEAPVEAEVPPPVVEAPIEVEMPAPVVEAPTPVIEAPIEIEQPSSITLTAARSYKPSRWADGRHEFNERFDAIVPRQLTVISGSAGKNKATLSFDDVDCTYDGGSKKSVVYTFKSCNDHHGNKSNIEVGSVLSSVKLIVLHINNGENSMTTEVSAVIINQNR